MGKDEEEFEKLQHTKERIDYYVAKQGEEHIYRKREGGTTNDNDQQAVLEDKYVRTSEVFSGKPFDEGRGSAATSTKFAWASADFEINDTAMVEPNDV